MISILVKFVIALFCLWLLIQLSQRKIVVVAVVGALVIGIVALAIHSSSNKSSGTTTLAAVCLTNYTPEQANRMFARLYGSAGSTVTAANITAGLAANGLLRRGLEDSFGATPAEVTELGYYFYGLVAEQEQGGTLDSYASRVHASCDATTG